MKVLRILVADDHAVVRQGVRTLIEEEPGWEVCGEAVTGHEAVKKAIQLKPDVVIVDLGMPELNGLEVTRQVRSAVPQSEVLVLTMHESEQVVREVLSAGARGYVLKSDAGRDLVAAITSLRQHRPFFTSKVATMVLQGYLGRGPRAKPGSPAKGRLTPRERQIVQLLAEGKSNKEVAAKLGLSVKTAETHRTNVMRKLELRSLSDLVRYAVRNRIIEP
jgi:DNA-binding NarL/FixJ family response regulator